MHLPACILLLRMIDELVDVARQRPITAGRVRREPTARVHGEASGLLPRLDGAITGRLDDDRPLATDPGDHGGPVFIIMAPAGLAFLAPTTRPASQRLLPAVCGLALVPRRVTEVIRFHCALQLAIGFVGKSRIAQPPAPAIAGGDMEPSCPGHASRRTRQAQQEGGEDPGRQRPLALVEQGVREVIEGALAAVTPGAFAAGAVVVRAPRINVLALAPG